MWTIGGILLLGLATDTRFFRFNSTTARAHEIAAALLRSGVQPEGDEEFTATLILRPYPLEWPKLPGPPMIMSVKAPSRS